MQTSCFCLQLPIFSMAQVPSYPASTPLAYPHSTPSRPTNRDATDDLLLSNANLVAENERLEGELADLYTRFNDMVNASVAKDRQHEDDLRHLAIAVQQDTLRHQQELTDLTRSHEAELNAKQDKAVREILGLMRELDSAKIQMREADAEHRRAITSLKSRLDVKIANEARLAEQLHDAKDDLHREHTTKKAAQGTFEAQLAALQNQLAAQIDEVNLSEFRMQRLEWQPASQSKEMQALRRDEASAKEDCERTRINSERARKEKDAAVKRAREAEQQTKRLKLKVQRIKQFLDTDDEEAEAMEHSVTTEVGRKRRREESPFGDGVVSQKRRGVRFGEDIDSERVGRSMAEVRLNATEALKPATPIESSTSSRHVDGISVTARYTGLSGRSGSTPYLPGSLGSYLHDPVNRLTEQTQISNQSVTRLSD